MCLLNHSNFKFNGNHIAIKNAECIKHTSTVFNKIDDMKITDLKYIWSQYQSKHTIYFELFQNYSNLSYSCFKVSWVVFVRLLGLTRS